MVTVQQVFDMAIHIIDEQHETNGKTMTVDTDEYKFRTISILNSVIPRLYYYSGWFMPDGEILTLKWDNYAEPDFTQEIALDDGLCLAVLPYFLAAQLVSGENTELANWCMNIYNTNFADLRDKVPAEFERIQTSYGGF